jgi:hypothetical protein
VKVRRDEGVVTRIGPEPCVSIREGTGEASAGVRTGRPSSREIRNVLGADAFDNAEGNTGGRAITSVRLAQRGREPGMCVRSSYGNREISRLTSG